MNITTTTLILRRVLQQQEIQSRNSKKITPILWGVAGIGKSEIVHTVGKELGYERIVDLRLGQMEIGDLTGLPDKEFYCPKCGQEYGCMVSKPTCIVPNCNGILKGKTVWLRPEWLPIPGQKTLIFLDEINRGRQDVLQAVFQLVLDRKLHTHVLPSDTAIICAANPPTEEYQVNDMDTALMDRFLNLVLEPQPDEWIKWAENNGLKVEIVDFIKTDPVHLGLTSITTFDLGIKPSPRSWDFLSQIFEFTPQPEWLKIAEAMVGATTATAFWTHMQEDFEKAVKPIDIINNWEKAKAMIQRQADANKLAVLQVAATDLVKFLQENQENMLPAQYDRAADFLVLLPKDLRMSVIKTIASTDDQTLSKKLLIAHQDIFFPEVKQAKKTVQNKI